jgi:hypothetical protein
MPYPVDLVVRPPFEDPLIRLGFLRALDRASLMRRKWPQEGVQRLMSILSKPNTLGNVCKTFGLFSNEEEERHVRRDWFGEDGKGTGWFPMAPMEALFRKGMVRAIELMLEHDLPLQSYWRIVGSAKRVQITFAISRQQITLIISTPPPRTRGRRSRVIPDKNIVVISHVRNRLRERTGLTPNPDGEPEVPPIPCRRLAQFFPAR